MYYHHFSHFGYGPHIPVGFLLVCFIVVALVKGVRS
jgi:hypothetical protein